MLSSEECVTLPVFSVPLNTGDLSEHLPQGYSGWMRAAASTGVAQSQSGLVHLLCSGAHLCFLPCPGRNLGLVPNPVRSHSRDKSLHLWGLSVVGHNVPSSSQGGWAPRGEMPLGGCVPVLLGSADVYPSFTHPHLPAGAWRPAACWGRASEWAVLPNRWKCSG